MTKTLISSVASVATVVSFALSSPLSFAMDSGFGQSNSGSFERAKAASQENRNRLVSVLNSPLNSHGVALQSGSKCEIEYQQGRLYVRGPRFVNGAQTQISIPLAATAGRDSTLVYILDPIRVNIPWVYDSRQKPTHFIVNSTNERPLTDTELASVNYILRNEDSRPKHVIKAMFEIEVQPNGINTNVLQAKFSHVIAHRDLYLGEFRVDTQSNFQLMCQ